MSKRGAERLREDMMSGMSKAGSIFDKARVAVVFDKIRKALAAFWASARDLFSGNNEKLASMSADDFADMMMNDLLRGFVPEGTEQSTDVKYQDVGEDTRFSLPEDEKKYYDKLDAKFNTDISNFNLSNADKFKFNIGNPSSILIDAGVENKPMILYGSKLAKKIKDHGFSPNDLIGLPSATNDPIAVFNNYKKDGNRSILTELKTSDGNILVAVEVGKGHDIDINIIKSAFGKGDEKIQNYFKNGLATYINERKTLNYLHLSAPIAEASDSSRSYSAANVVNLSQLNKLLGEKLYVRTKNFKKWFGDWENDAENSSKIVDENGEPLVVYKRTAGKVNVFDTKFGSFFSSEPIEDLSFGVA